MVASLYGLDIHVCLNYHNSLRDECERGLSISFFIQYHFEWSSASLFSSTLNGVLLLYSVAL